MPVGHVSLWQARTMMQPSAIIAAVPKEYSSAPSSAAITTSRPVRKPPSTRTRMRERRSFSMSTRWVSARPSSHGSPAYLIDISGDAPVPPLQPLICTTSANAFATVGLGADEVHRLGQRLVRLAADGAVRHRACREAGGDRARRLDVVKGDRRARGDELQQVSKLGRRAVVDQRGELGVRVVLTVGDGPLQEVRGLHLVQRLHDVVIVRVVLATLAHAVKAGVDQAGFSMAAQGVLAELAPA